MDFILIGKSVEKYGIVAPYRSYFADSCENMNEYVSMEMTKRTIDWKFQSWLLM